MNYISIKIEILKTLKKREKLFIKKSEVFKTYGSYKKMQWEQVISYGKWKTR